jgi:flagellin
MSSIVTNGSAIAALQGYRSTREALAATERRVATGLKISTAADNASTWGVTETIKSDRGVTSTVADSLGVESQMLSVAIMGVESVVTVMNEIKSAVAQAAQPGADTSKLATSLVGLSSKIREIVASSSFAGVNLLDGSRSDIAFTTGYRDGMGAGSSLTALDFTPTKLFARQEVDEVNRTGAVFHDTIDTGILAAADDKIFDNFTWFSDSDPADPGTFFYMTDAVGYVIGDGAGNIYSHYGFADIVSDHGSKYAERLASGHYESTMTAADLAIAKLADYASSLGSAKAVVDSQRAFMRVLDEGLETGVGALVDADMNEEATRLQALQTREQLAVQTMSVANRNSEITLRLFQAA